MLLSNGKQEVKKDNRWIVEVKIYSEMQNPAWAMRKRSVNKVLRLINRLPLYENGFPDVVVMRHTNLTLTSSDDFTVHCFDGILVIRKGNLIEIKEDIDRSVENEILKSAPDQVYKDIYYYI